MRIRRQIFVIVTALLAVTTLHATTLARLNIDQLAVAAEDIARVRCASVESRWEDGAIWTVMTFNVVETMKGNLPSQVTVRLPGGRIGHLTATVDGTPKFNPGSDAIVFLERARSREFTVTGWVQGTFRISRNRATSRETVTQDSSTFSVFDTGTRSFHTEGIRQMPVEQFRARVAAAVTRQGDRTR